MRRCDEAIVESLLSQGHIFENPGSNRRWVFLSSVCHGGFGVVELKCRHERM